MACGGEKHVQRSLRINGKSHFVAALAEQKPGQQSRFVVSVTTDGCLGRFFQQHQIRPVTQVSFIAFGQTVYQQIVCAFAAKIAPCLSEIGT